MVFPRENGLVTLTKFVAICALSASSLLGVQASQSAEIVACATPTSPGDASVGIKIISDAKCAAGGLGCIDSICRFCKERETPQSAHFLSCATLLPATTTTTTTTTVTTAPVVTTTVTTAPAVTTVPGVTTTTCTASDGDLAVGIQAIPDAACSAGGLGCFNDGCRFCQYSENPKSAHLLTCSSFGYNFPTLAPVAAPVVDASACGVSDGDFAVGIRAITDATCLTGGLGCFNNFCRFCKETVTPQSAHLGDCSSYSVTTSAPVTSAPVTSAPVTSAPVTSAPVTAAPVTTVPVVTTAAPTVEPTFKPEDVVTSCSIDDATASIGLGIVLDATATSSDTDFASAGCRYCKVADTAGLETFKLCSLYPNYVTPTIAPTVCTTTVAAGDAAVGIQIVTDTSCATGGLGCIDSVCRFCKLSSTPQSAHLTDCAIVLDPTATVAPAPVTVAPTTCSTTVSAGDAAVGINIVADATCALGGVGCIDSICRFCKVAETPQSTQFVGCPGVIVTAPPATVAPVTAAPTACSTTVTAGDAAVGISIFSDATCAAGGVGCIDSICRFCKVAETTQSTQFVACPGVVVTAAPATVAPVTAAPVTTGPVTAAPSVCATTVTEGDAAVGINIISDATCAAGGVGCIDSVCRFCKVTTTAQSTHLDDCTAHTPAPTAEPVFDPNDISGTVCSIADEFKAFGIDVVLDATVTEANADYFIAGCRFCKTVETVESASFTSCSSFAGYGAATTTAPVTTSPVTTSPVTTAPVTAAPVTTAAPATPVAPTGACTQVVTEGDAAVGIQITSDATCVAGGVGCIDSVCRYCKISTTAQSAHLVDCSGIAVATAAPATTTAPGTTTAPVVTVAPVTYSPGSCAPVSSGDAAVGIQIIADASCAAGGVGCIDNDCRFCKTSTTPQSAHFGDCSSYVGGTTTTTAAPAVTDPATGTTVAPATTTAPVVTAAPVTYSPGSCAPVSSGDAAVGIQIIADASCAAGGVGCIDNGCRFCKTSTTPQSAHFGDCSSYVGGAATTTAAPAVTDPATGMTTAPVVTVAPVVTAAPVTYSPGSCAPVSAGDAAVGIQIIADATCVAGGIGCIDNGCRFCKTSTTPQSANFGDCASFTGVAAATTAPAATVAATTAPAVVTPDTTAPVAPVVTTAPVAPVAPSTTCTSVVSEGDSAAGLNMVTDATCLTTGGPGCVDGSACKLCKVLETSTSTSYPWCQGYAPPAVPVAPAAPVVTTAPAAPVAPSTTCTSVVSEGDSAAGLNMVTDATCLTTGGSGCVDGSACKLCKVAETTTSTTYPWCPGYAPAVTTAATPAAISAEDATAAAVTTACVGQTISDGDLAGGVVFSYDPEHCPAGTTVGCVGEVGCKFCKEFDSEVSSHWDWCPGYPSAELPALRVQSSGAESKKSNKSTETSLSSKIRDFFSKDPSMVAGVAAACVGSIALIALVVVGTKRAARRLRRGSINEFDDEEDEEEEGSVLSAVTEDTATATGVTAEEANASLSGEV